MLIYLLKWTGWIIYKSNILLGENAKKAAQTAFSLKKNNGRPVPIKGVFGLCFQTTIFSF